MNHLFSHLSSAHKSHCSFFVMVEPRFSNCGTRPLGGGAVGPLVEGGQVHCIRDILILNEIRTQSKIYILIACLKHFKVGCYRSLGTSVVECSISIVNNKIIQNISWKTWKENTS